MSRSAEPRGPLRSAYASAASPISRAASSASCWMSPRRRGGSSTPYMRRAPLATFTMRSPDRSRSALIFRLATMARRSDAIGCCRARSRKQRSSMSMEQASSSSSPAITAAAVSMS